MVRPLLSLVRIAVSIGAVLIVTAVCHLLVPVNPTTVALAYVVVILLVASALGRRRGHGRPRWSRRVCLNVFFLPPVGTLTIADPQNWVALAVFLVTGIVASQLSGRARRRTVEAEARRRDLEQLLRAEPGAAALTRPADDGRARSPGTWPTPSSSRRWRSSTTAPTTCPGPVD